MPKNTFLAIVFFLSFCFTKTEGACTYSPSPNVNCAQRGHLVISEMNAPPPLVLTLFNMVYNPTTSDPTKWTPARQNSFTSYWHGILYAISPINGDFPQLYQKINEIVRLLAAFSGNNCEWQASVYNHAKICFNGLFWGTISDFIGCGNAPADYTLPPAPTPQTPPGALDQNGCPVVGE